MGQHGILVTLIDDRIESKYVFSCEGEDVYCNGEKMTLIPDLSDEEIKVIVDTNNDRGDKIANVLGALYYAPYVKGDLVTDSILDEIVLQVSGLDHHFTKDQQITITHGTLINNGQEYDLPTNGSSAAAFNYREFYNSIL